MLTLMISFVLIPVVGLAIDGTRGYLVRLKLSSAVDGASLASARLLGTGATSAAQKANAVATAQAYVHANFPTNFFGATIVTGDPYVCVDNGDDASDPCGVGNGGSVQTYKVRTVYVAASAQMSTWFMRIIGMSNIIVKANGMANRRDVRVVLVMDRSSSMTGYYTGLNQTPPSINDLALSFVNSFSGSGDFGGRDELGLVVFGGSAIVAYPPRDISHDYSDYKNFTPPDNNFKLPANMPKYIADINDGSNTGTAEALYMAYSTLRADANTNSDLATKLNVIVLFTDGLPNGITANANDFHNNKPPATNNPYYMMTVGSGCTDLTKGTNAAPLVSSANKNMIGWFAQHNGYATGWGGSNPGAWGLFTPMMYYADTGYSGHANDIDAYMQNAGDDNASITQMAGCNSVGSNGSPMYTNSGHANTSSTMTQFPPYDLYGNYTDLSTVPAVNGAKPPLGTGGVPLYQMGSLYSDPTQCNNTGYVSTSTWDACQIGLASWAATAHQAWKIWNQVVWDKPSQTNVPDPGTYLPQPVIFTIGFDHSPTDHPDMNLLQIIANDAAAPVSISNRPDRVHGKAYLASDANAVNAAFQQIASEILRLSR
jgi:Flp pilus assembly protein TadG